MCFDRGAAAKANRESTLDSGDDATEQLAETTTLADRTKLKMGSVRGSGASAVNPTTHGPW